MADGCLLLVDAFEGPMPQTRFVLQKALQLGLKPIVVVNKVDKPNCRPEEVYEMVFDLMCDLNATEEQLDFKVVYELSLDDAVKLGFVAPYKITVVTVPLNKVDKNFKAGSAKKPFMTTEFANMEYLNELYEHTPIGKRFRIALTRMRAIHNLPSKREAAKFILDNVIPKEDRTLIFASNIEQANYLCENTFHSKVASKDYDAFKAGEINRLSCVLAVNEGHNFPNLDSGLIVQLNSNDKDLIQRIGRLVRFRVGHEASLYVVVAENTQDMVWLRLATEGIDASNIEYVSLQELKNKYKN